VAEAYLPREFSDLEPFAATWCLATEGERWTQRMNTSIEEMRSFYNAVFARMDAMLAYCDGFPLGDMPDEVERLLQLAFSFVMVSFPVEVWDDPSIPDTGDANLMRVEDPAVGRRDGASYGEGIKTLDAH
jgi:hypothetical protein